MRLKITLCQPCFKSNSGYTEEDDFLAESCNNNFDLCQVTTQIMFIAKPMEITVSKGLSMAIVPLYFVMMKVLVYIRLLI